MSRNGRRDPISDITTSRSAVFGAEVDDLIRELAGRGEWENHFASQYVDSLHCEWGELRETDPEGATQMLSSFAVALRSELDDLRLGSMVCAGAVSLLGVGLALAVLFDLG